MLVQSTLFLHRPFSLTRFVSLANSQERKKKKPSETVRVLGDVLPFQTATMASPCPQMVGCPSCVTQDTKAFLHKTRTNEHMEGL